MSKTKCTHNTDLSQCCVVFPFLKHHLAHILEFKHNPFLVYLFNVFEKSKSSLNPNLLFHVMALGCLQISYLIVYLLGIMHQVYVKLLTMFE